MPNKIKNISLNRGIVRTPGYSQSEGELSECINLIPRGGELVNILPPYPTGVTPIAGTEVFLAVHRVSPENIDHFIVFYQGALHWRTDTSRRTYLLSTTQADIKSIQPIGNILCITTTSGIHYFLWKDGAYVDLEDADFNLDIQFGIRSRSVSKALSERASDGSRDGRAASTVKVALTSETRDNTDVPWSVRSWKAEPIDGVASFAVDLSTATEYYIALSTFATTLMQDWQLRVTLYRKTDSGVTQEAQHTAPAGKLNLTFTTPASPVINRVVVDVVRGGTTLVPHSYPVVMTEVLAGTTDTTRGVYKIVDYEDSVVGLANELIAAETKDNRFTMPFFARFAIKLTTGQYTYLSEPCFLEPNTIYAPSIALTPRYDRTQNIGHEGVDCEVYARAYSSDLFFRINANGLLAKLKQYEDVVEGIAIAVTPPVYLYDQAVSDEDLADADKCVIRYARDFNATVYESWGRSLNTSRTLLGLYRESVVSNELKLILPTGGESQTSEAMAGGQNTHSTVYVDTAIQQRRLDALATWYVVAEIPLRALSDTSGWNKVSLKPGALSAIYAQDTSIALDPLVDTLTTNLSVKASAGEFAYNNRLFHFGGSEHRHRDWQPARMSGFCPSDGGSWVPDGSNGYRYEVHFEDGSMYGIYSIDTNGQLLGRLRFMAFPDAEAVSGFTSSGYTSMKLGPQGVAEMAVGFWDTWAERPSSAPERTYPDTAHPNKLYMSYANQPLALDRNAALTFSGEIRAMSVVTKALTQGQFGKFPLYVFTSDGIWMLEINDEGAIRFSNPVSRDVITAGTQPLQTDDAIFFITEQGLKRVVGQEVTLVSEPVHGFNPRGSKLHINQEYSIFKWHAELLAQDDTVDFVKALQSARLLYDYTQQLIHVYIGTSTHYVYSKSDNAWAQQILISGGTDYEPEVMANPTGIIPAYPLSYVQYQNSRLSALCQYSAQTKNVNDLDTAPQRGLFFAGRIALALTRPITLEDPTTMAALMDFRLIKQDTGRHYSMMRPWATAIFGSRDGAYWHHITSLKRGSYKYFRFLILTNMTDNESVQGLTIAYQPRRTNRLR